jgi:hypothetical protein
MGVEGESGEDLDDGGGGRGGVEMDAEEERVRGVDQVMVGEAIDEALAVDPTTVDEATVV